MIKIIQCYPRNLIPLYFVGIYVLYGISLYCIVNVFSGVRPYKCLHCEKAFTQRCSLESHCRKVHNVSFHFAHKERRDKVYVCEECGHSTGQPEVHYHHMKDRHPNTAALLRCHDKRQFKFSRAAVGGSEGVSGSRGVEGESRSIILASEESSSLSMG